MPYLSSVSANPNKNVNSYNNTDFDLRFLFIPLLFSYFSFVQNVCAHFVFAVHTTPLSYSVTLSFSASLTTLTHFVPYQIQ